jgi:hypothetical protein
MRNFRLFSWIVAGLALYFLSSGPVWCVVRHMNAPIDKMRTIYAPVKWLSNGVQDVFERYTMLWAPGIQ